MFLFKIMVAKVCRRTHATLRCMGGLHVYAPKYAYRTNLLPTRLLLLQHNPEAFCNCYPDLPIFYLFLAFYCCILDIGGERHYLGDQMSGYLSMVSYLSCYKRPFSLKLKAYLLHALLDFFY